MGYHSLFQGIFLAQRLNPHLLHWQAVSLPLVPPGHRILRDMQRELPECLISVRIPESGWPFPAPGGLPHPGTEPTSPGLQADCYGGTGEALTGGREEYKIRLNSLSSK